jgi:hypothetical protein
MKIKFFAIALAALSLIACEKEPEPIVPEQADYVGTLTVEATAGTVVNSEARIDFLPFQDGTAELMLYEVKFSPKMPMKLDVLIPGITITSTPEKVILSGNEIVPLAMGGNQFPQYTVTDLKGEIVGDKLSFTLKLGDIPTSFVGEKVEETTPETQPEAK